MLERFWSYIKSLMSGGLDKRENPELLLEQAQNAMREAQAQNRMRAVEAVTAKNYLQQQVKDTQKRIDNLSEKADAAEKRGDLALAQSLRRERDRFQKSLDTMETQLARAIEISERVKNSIQREEEKIREKTAEALALKAQWRNTQQYNNLIGDFMHDYQKPRPNPPSDRFFRWLVASYLFVVAVLVLVLLIIRAGRW